MQKKGSNAKKSILPKYSFLLNSNLSRIIASQLSELLTFDFKHISQISEIVFTDEQIIEIAKKENRIIITHDLDYGEIYYLKEHGKIGVIMLRLDNQRTDNVIKKLIKFFKERKYKNYNLNKTLTIISGKKVRFFSP